METLGAAISTTGGAIGAALTNRNNRKMQQAANQENRQMWHLQNEYNHPSSQMARLRTAGLNPNMMYGQSAAGATGQAASSPDMKAAKNENSLAQLAQYQDWKLKGANIDNLRTQNTVITQDAALKSAQTASELTKNSQGQFDLGMAKELKNNSLQVAQQSLAQLQQNVIGSQIDNQIKGSTKNSQIQRIITDAAVAKQTLHGQKLDNKLKQLSIELRANGIQENDPLWMRYLQRDANEGFKKIKDLPNQILNIFE